FSVRSWLRRARAGDSEENAV
nr:bone sialoprotein, BSP {N-terminal} [chickens, 10-14 week old, bone powder, Peptide Partial, 20 aa] [Gallus gallus]